MFIKYSRGTRHRAPTVFNRVKISDLMTIYYVTEILKLYTTGRVTFNIILCCLIGYLSSIMAL